MVNHFIMVGLNRTVCRCVFECSKIFVCSSYFMTVEENRRIFMELIIGVSICFEYVVEGEIYEVKGK